LKYFIAILLFYVFSVQLTAQNYLKQNEYYHTLVNGLKVVLIEDTLAQEISVQLSINAGTSYEANGIAGGTAFIAANVHSNFKGYNTECIITNDYTGYYSTIQTAEMLPSLFSAYLNAVTEEVKPNNTDLNTSYIQYNTSFTSCTANKGCESAVKIIYTNNENRLGEPMLSFPDDSVFVKNVAKFKSSFYCPQNAFLIVNGNFKRAAIYKTIQNVFLDWKDCTYSPFRTFPVQTINTCSYNVQLTTNDESVTEGFNIYYSGPVLYKNKKETLTGLLFASILNDEYSALRNYYADSFNVKEVSSDFNMRRFISLFSIKYVVDTNQLDFISNYNNLAFLSDASLYNTNDLSRNKTTLISKIMAKPDTKSYINTLALFNATSSIDYFGKIQDTINAISVKDILGFVNKFLLKNNYVAVLNSNFFIANNDTIYAQTSVTPNSYNFYFKRNTADFLEENVDSILNSLAQWLKINPLVKIKINGVATTDELLTVKDDAMLEFYKKNPEFVIAPSDLIPTKKIRLDVLRSMTIVKMLVDKGISLNQISGTGKLATKTDEANETQKVYCTIRTL
jgi:predicted Zn-dependent peptidase